MTMDLKFENRYIITDEMLSEYVRKVLCRKIRFWGLIISAAALIMLVITLSDHSYILAAVFGTCLIIAGAVTIATPSLTLKQLKETGRRVHNGQTFETVVKFGDQISISEGSFSFTVEYAQILKIYSLRYSYILMFGKSNAVMIRPDGFTTGTFAEFVPFIQSMCPLDQ
jgi:hypothetical protein